MTIKLGLCLDYICPVSIAQLPVYFHEAADVVFAGDSWCFLISIFFCINKGVFDLHRIQDSKLIPKLFWPIIGESYAKSE